MFQWKKLILICGCCENRFCDSCQICSCFLPGGTQLWVTRHVPPKRPYFFSLAFTERPPFLPTFTQWPPIFQKFRHFWRNVEKFLAILALKAPIFYAFTERPPIYVRFVTQRPPFLTQFVTERPLHLRCLVALIRHFHMWVPPSPGCFLMFSLQLVSSTDYHFDCSQSRKTPNLYM